MDNPSRTPNPNLVVAGILVVIAILVPAYIWAEHDHIRTGPLLNIAGVAVTGFLAMLGVTNGIRSVTGQLDRVESTTNDVARQTNGVLDARIESAVARALAQRDATLAASAATVPNPGVTPTSEPPALHP